jgi:hypothetical protein
MLGYAKSKVKSKMKLSTGGFFIGYSGIFEPQKSRYFFETHGKSNRFFYGSLFLTETAIREKLEI